MYGVVPNPDLNGEGMLCPLHSGIQFPCEQTRRFRNAFKLALAYAPEQRVFCGSDLSSDDDKRKLNGYAALQQIDVYFTWNSEVTDVIAATDEKGACLRTFQVLVAILRGKRILDIKWLRAWADARGHPVNENLYKIKLGKIRKGRIVAPDTVCKLFNGICFYFAGKFVATYKSHLIDLIKVCGGTVNSNKSKLDRHQADISTNIVVYNRDDECRCDERSTIDSPIECRYDSECKGKSEEMIEEAETLAKGIGAWIIPHSWILDSVDSDRVLPS